MAILYESAFPPELGRRICELVHGLELAAEGARHGKGRLPGAHESVAAAHGREGRLFPEGEVKQTGRGGCTGNKSLPAWN